MDSPFGPTRANAFLCHNEKFSIINGHLNLNL